jgi:hypothetical protein
MNQTITMQPVSTALSKNFPLLRLLAPRQFTKTTWISLAIGLALGILGMQFGGIQRWVATSIVILVLLPVAVLKFRDDRRLYGTTVMLLSILVTAQGAHAIEHIVQWVQYHMLFWTMRQSNGLLSAANAEWVHFVWNWAVLLMVVAIMMGGMRNGWAYLLLAITVAHTFEHTYMFIRHLEVLSELRRLGVTTVTAQGLPGILGRDGWLARSVFTQGTFLCSIPGLTTATRLDVHFWWNVLEAGLLLAAGHVYLRQRPLNLSPFTIHN